MSEVKFKDNILEAIAAIKRRKARPNKDRIRKYTFRHFGISCKDTDAALEQLVEQQLVIPVPYKGETSYRDPEHWSKFQIYRSSDALKGVVDRRVFISKVHHTILDVFDELLLDHPDYYDNGVPEEEFKKYINYFKDVKKMYGVDSLLRKGVESGLLIKHQSGNYSVALDDVSATTDLPVASKKEDKTPEKHSESMSQDIFKPSCSNYRENEPNPITKSVGSRVITEEQNTSCAKMSSDSFPGLNCSIASRREPRKRKIKKVFDPSVICSSATKHTHLSADNVSKAGKTVEKLLCLLCNSDTVEDVIKCRVCSAYYHRSCVLAKYGLNIMLSYWTCFVCRNCAICFKSVESAKMLICTKCNKVFHITCQIPKLTEKLSNKTWVCLYCQEEGESQPLSSSVPKTSMMAEETVNFASAPVTSINNVSDENSTFKHTSEQNASSDRLSKHSTSSKQCCNQKSSMKRVSAQTILPRKTSGKKGRKLHLKEKLAPKKKSEQKTMLVKASDQKTLFNMASEQQSAPDSTGVSFLQNEMCKITIDENIPDVSKWTVRRVYNYFVRKGFADQASIFKENGVDGPTLLMLTRDDVLYKLQIKLGPALKIYHQVRILQAKAAGKSFICYE